MQSRHEIVCRERAVGHGIATQRHQLNRFLRRCIKRPVVARDHPACRRRFSRGCQVVLATVGLRPTGHPGRSGFASAYAGTRDAMDGTVSLRLPSLTNSRSAFRYGMTGWGYRLFRPLSLRYRLRSANGYGRRISWREGNCPREAEAQAPVPEPRVAPATVRRPAVLGAGSPKAAPLHPVRASPRPRGIVQRRRCVVTTKPILTPFPHIAMHIVKAPRVRRLLAHRMAFTLSIETNPRMLLQRLLKQRHRLPPIPSCPATRVVSADERLSSLQQPESGRRAATARS